MELLKLLDSSTIVVQIISFLILLFVLRIFFWNKFLKLLDARSERIKSEMQAIADAKKETENLKQDYERKMAVIDATCREKIQQASYEAQKLAEEITRAAHQESQKIIEITRQNIKYEITQAQAELKDQLIDFVVDTTGKVLEKKLSGDDDRKIVEKLIQEMDTLT